MSDPAHRANVTQKRGDVRDE